MSQCEEFLEYLNKVILNQKEPEIEMSDNVKKFIEQLNKAQDNFSVKPVLTERGIEILSYMRTSDKALLKAKDIAEGMEVSSRKISGAMLKLLNEGFVDKFSSNPNVYVLTEKGKNVELKGE